MKVERRSGTTPTSSALTTDQQAEIRARYGGKDEPGTPPSAADVSVVLVARDEDGDGARAAVRCASSGTAPPR